MKKIIKFLYFDSFPIVEPMIMTSDSKTRRKTGYSVKKKYHDPPEEKLFLKAKTFRKNMIRMVKIGQ